MIEQRANWWQIGLGVALFGGFCVLVLLPLGSLVAASFLAKTTEPNLIRETLLDAPLQQAILTTLAVGLLATALASLIAFPAAHIALRANSAVRALLGLMAVLPLAMPPFVNAALLLHLQRILDQTGIAPALAAVEISGSHVVLGALFALHYLPIILFCLVAGLSRMHDAANESARNLGGSGLHVWRHITLPMITPAYGLGVSLVLLRIFEDAGTPLMLGIEDMLAPQIVLGAQTGSYATPELIAAVLAMCALALVVVVLGWSSLSAPFTSHWRALRIQPACRRRGAGAAMITLALVLGLGRLALLPFVWLLLMSFTSDWSTDLTPMMPDPGIYPRSLLEIVPGIKLTLIYATATGLLVVLLGSAIAALTRGNQRMSRVAIFAATLLFAVPGLALALAYANGYGLLGLGRDDWPRFAWPALALVLALKQLPLAQHLIALRLRCLHEGELASAYSLGASRSVVAFRIRLPSLSGVLGIVFLLGWCAALIELSVAMLLIETPPLPMSLHLFRSLLGAEDIQTPASQALLLVLMTAAVVLILWWLSHRVCRRIPQPPLQLSRPARTPA